MDTLTGSLSNGERLCQLQLRASNAAQDGLKYSPQTPSTHLRQYSAVYVKVLSARRLHPPVHQPPSQQQLRGRLEARLEGEARELEVLCDGV